MARVFGAFNAFILAGILLGGLVAPLLINHLGLTVTLWIVGVGIPAASLLGWPSLHHADALAGERLNVLKPKIALLQHCDLINAVTEGTLEQLASAAEDMTAQAGQTVIVEGEPADAFYVLQTGTMNVTARREQHKPTQLRTLSAGDYFGEIGLIEGIPRTATVTAAEPSTLLRINGSDFIAALTQAKPSTALLDTAASRLNLTHPTQRLTKTGLSA